jgi:hypothetical protein
VKKAPKLIFSSDLRISWTLPTLPAPVQAICWSGGSPSNQNQPKPTDNDFPNSVGFGWFKLVLVGFGYPVPNNAGKSPRFCSDSKLPSQPKPTASNIAQRTEADAQNFSAENFSENHLRTTKETLKFDRKTAKNALQFNSTRALTQASQTRAQKMTS